MQLHNRAGNRGLVVRAGVVAAALFGCTATIDGDTIPLLPGAAGTTGNGGSATAFPTTATGQMQGAGPRPLMRLTRRQYASAVKDLLGTSALPEPVSRFTPETVGDSGFIGVLPAVSTLDARVYMEAAEAFEQAGAARIGELSKCSAGADAVACARTFVQSFGRQAYRRPLETTEVDELVVVYQSGRELGYDYPKAIGLVVQAMLESPFFLYQWELGAKPAKAAAGEVALTSHEVAARLALGIWGTLPDAELMRAADAGELKTPEAVVSQTRRLLSDVKRASETLWDFYVQWLFLKSAPNLGNQLKKDPVAYPEFNDALRDSMIAETRGFLDRVVLSDNGTLTDLTTARWSLVDGRLASLYGVPDAAGDALARADLPATERSGLFTQPLFLSALSTDGGTLPPRMGNTVWTRMLCGPMAAVPDDVPLPPEPAPNVTTRERFSKHSEGPCIGCHRMLDPLGFAFENYDAIGRFRTREGDRPVDASGALILPSGQQLEFSNAVELLTQLSASSDFSRCFSDQWLRYVLGRPLVESDAGTPASVHENFKTSGLNVKELLLALVSSKAFLYRTVAEGEVVQ